MWWEINKSCLLYLISIAFCGEIFGPAWPFVISATGRELLYIFTGILLHSCIITFIPNLSPCSSASTCSIHFSYLSKSKAFFIFPAYIISWARPRSILQTFWKHRTNGPCAWYRLRILEHWFRGWRICAYRTHSCAKLFYNSRLLNNP